MKRHTASLEAALANLKKTAKVTQVEDLLPKIVREKCKFGVVASVLLEWRDQRKHSHLQNHGVVIYGEGTYLKIVFHLSTLKPKALVASKAPRGRCDFDKFENITGKYRQSNLT